MGPSGTDGHVDGVLQYVAPGHVMLETVLDEGSPDFERGQRNLEVLRSSTDAAGRRFQISLLDPGADNQVSYANHYLANGAVVVPIDGGASDEAALATLRAIYPDRQIVGVPGTTLAYGGGGPHCITQQIPAGVALADMIELLVLAPSARTNGRADA